MEDVASETPRIYAAFDDHQADHQSSMVKVEGKIENSFCFY